MLGRRRLVLGLGLAATLAACRNEGGPDPDSARADAARRAAGLDVGPDPDFESLLPARAGDDPLAPLGAALRALERGARGRGDAAARGRTGVLLLGDSHIAYPVLAERLRELLQSRYGAIGPGRLSPGRAQRFFNPAGLTRGQAGDWTAATALRSATPGPFGLTGYRLSGSQAGDSVSLATSDPAGFDRIHLTLACSPESGSFRLRAAGLPEEPVATRTPAPAARLIRLDVPRGSREFTLELVGDGPVELLGWGIDRRGPGVMVEAFGINGATLSTLDNREPSILARELAVAPPALVILEYGTNEATAADFDGAAYEAQLRRRIAALRAALPRSGILLMGVPDAGRPRALPPRRRGAPPPGPCDRVAPLPALGEVRAAQRRVAQAERVGFFDWSAEVTRSPCRLPELARADPPLMRGDLVHFTPEGYRLIAERLHAHLLRGAGITPRGAGA